MPKLTAAFEKALAHDPLFDLLVGTAVDGIMFIDDRGVLRFYNDACERLFGYARDEVIGHNVNMLMPAPYREEHDAYIQRYLKTGERHIIGIGREVIGRRKDGGTFPMYLSVGEGTLDGIRIFVGIVHDITERNRSQKRIHELQAELLHVTRLMAMGQMSSALAHELNQPLTAILSYANAASKMSTMPDTDHGEFQEILKKLAEQATRAGNIIRRLRAFVEKHESKRSGEDINKLVEESISLGLIATRDSGVRIDLALASNLPPVGIDRIEIQQVLINLMRNATEAMQGRTERILFVSTSRESTEYVLVSVKDTGPGLPPEVSERLFQPFVSTKSNGMGMGLNISRTIVEAHGGKLWVESKPGAGAIFRFRLPIHPDTDVSDE